MLLRLTFQVTPRGKQTARTTLQGGRARTWTPEQTGILEDMIRTLAIHQLNQKGLPQPLVKAPAPVFLVTTYHLPKPKRGVYTGLAWPTCKPDLSNMTKLLEDALTGVVWTDDRQIVQNLESKRWADPRPGIDLLVADLEELHRLFPSVDGTATPTSSSGPASGFASSLVSHSSTRTTFRHAALVVGIGLLTSGLCLGQLTTAATRVI